MTRREGTRAHPFTLHFTLFTMSTPTSEEDTVNINMEDVPATGTSDANSTGDSGDASQAAEAGNAHNTDSTVDDDPMEGEDDRIQNDKSWTSGDFELISVDNVRFRVPSYYLFTAR